MMAAAEVELPPLSAPQSANPPLEGDLPLALRARPRYAGPCMNRKCDHSDGMHHRVVGGILGDRYVCDVCLATGGHCR